jgi:hypothetical protein
MTMNCPVCGTIMIWLNGSISHDPPIKYYECRVCNINVTKQPDGSYEMVEAKKQKQKRENKKNHKFGNIKFIKS